MIRATLHFLFCLLAIPFWVSGILCLALALLPALVAHRINPRSSMSNCWIYACPRWFHRGGYFVIRAATGIKFLSVLSVPHVAWMPNTPPEGTLKHFSPVNRKTNRWFPFFAGYFRGEVTDLEHPVTIHDKVTIVQQYDPRKHRLPPL